MSSVKLYQVEKNEGDIIRTILINTIKMLSERGLIKKNNLNEIIKKITTNIVDDMIYKITVDDTTSTDETNKIYVVKIILQKITSVGKTTGIIDFLNKYKDDNKIIIVKNINKKARQYIINNYTNAEIFLEEDLMINLIDHELVPKHVVLGSDEAKIFYEKYNCKKKNIPRMLSTDPVAKYYNMKPGQICRIIRPSETSGFVPSYRLVVFNSSK